MSRTLRISIFAALALIVGLVGSAVAFRAPESSDGRVPAANEADESDAPPAAEDLAHAADRLSNAGVTVDDAELEALAGRYGLGGAVRLLAWSSSTGLSVDEITAMRDGDGTTPGMGWGRIAKELGVHPGIGSIMGNRGASDE